MVYYTYIYIYKKTFACSQQKRGPSDGNNLSDGLHMIFFLILQSIE